MRRPFGNALTSVMGQTRRIDPLTATSGAPSTSDIAGPSRHFRKGPKADMNRPRRPFIVQPLKAFYNLPHQREVVPLARDQQISATNRC